MADLSVPIAPQAEYTQYGTRPAQNRERAVSSMSTISARSRRSSDSKRLELIESPKDKKRLGTKADPSRALAEATPGNTSVLLQSISHLTHSS